MAITTLLPGVRTYHCSLCFVPSEGILSLGFLTDPNYKFTALSHTGICSKNKFYKKSGMSKVEYKLYNWNFGTEMKVNGTAQRRLYFKRGAEEDSGSSWPVRAACLVSTLFLKRPGNTRLKRQEHTGNPSLTCLSLVPARGVENAWQHVHITGRGRWGPARRPGR